MKDLANTLDTILNKYRDIEKNLLHQDKLNKATLIKLNKEYAIPAQARKRLPINFEIAQSLICL